MNSHTPSKPVGSKTGTQSCGTGSQSGGFDNHCILLLSRLEHRSTLLHNPSSADGRQKALDVARTTLADILEFAQATGRQSLLERNSEDIWLISDSINDVDQLLDGVSLWGLLGFKSGVEEKQTCAYHELGDGYVGLLEILLSDIGKSMSDKSQAAEWDASFRPIVADIKRLW